MLGDLGRVKWHLWTQPKSGPLIYFSFWLETGPLFTGLKIWTQMGQVRFGLSPYWDRFRSEVLLSPCSDLSGKRWIWIWFHARNLLNGSGPISN